jgi:hypothetical protein
MTMRRAWARVTATVVLALVSIYVVRERKGRRERGKTTHH